MHSYLISHDTEFMNQVVNVIYHLEFAKLTRYSANYEKFLEMADMNKAQHIDAYEKQQEYIKKQEDFIQRNKARASTSGRAKSREKQLGSELNVLIGRKKRPKPTFKFKESRASSKTVFEGIDFEIGYTYPLLPKMTYDD